MRTIARHRSSSAACLLSISLLISTPVSSETNKPARLSLGDTSLEGFEIDMGTPARQTVLTGFLTESKTADLGIVHLTSEGLPTLRLYSLAHGNWKLNQETLLPRDLLMVDIVRIGNQDRILGYRPGELLWFGSDMKQMEGHLTLTSNFTPPRPNEVPHVDMTEDLNGDGRDDLVVSAQDGFFSSPALLYF